EGATPGGGGRGPAGSVGKHGRDDQGEEEGGAEGESDVQQKSGGEQEQGDEGARRPGHPGSVSAAAKDFRGDSVNSHAFRGRPWRREWQRATRRPRTVSAGSRRRAGQVGQAAWGRP